VYVLGIDIGSLVSKGLVLDANDKIMSYISIRSRPNSELSASDVLELALEKAKLRIEDISYVVATGYGRVRVPYADGKVTEIICHARGINWINPEVRTFIDIGGQDSKAVYIGKEGKVLNFTMNDKCAAGTGRFLEVMAGALEVGLSELGEIALTAKRAPHISSVCTIFAESEILSLMAQGEPREQIALGLCNSIASRIYSMLLRVEIKEKFAMTGGGSKNRALVEIMKKYTGLEVYVPDEPQSTGALGAALIAKERVTSGHLHL